MRLNQPMVGIGAKGRKPMTRPVLVGFSGSLPARHTGSRRDPLALAEKGAACYSCYLLLDQI